ncbi:redoxin domain-containing protein [Paenibacillus macquariensis]|uniref:Peroxiredoxin n=1 Tax=Paenibacillus macquariensis TaxID=948756 RepID=A0ABY1JJV6_9BACL|nr:redoxin domain-containing protein [Paenibacillus macquariensis]MEC0089805.1 redoxin domain-containing protein [Paenibacillus macquariensis]OAB30726.1 alkyl hydroperoxide reductase [Paenibacillus macquariensis subsp. macquariensis]SIQ31567.1 Peroxiredoxin [Paenibacillus macquariensis]
MGKSRKKVQIVILLMIVILGGYAIISNVYGSGGKPEVGDKAPSFNLLGLDGSVHNLDEYKGKAMVINFWGTWCKPCVKEMPALQAQSEKWKYKDVVVIGINAGEDIMSVDNFAKQANISFQILLDPNKEAIQSYGISPLPTTFFVAANGKIKKIHLGELDLNALDYEIEQLVSNK